MQPQFQQPMNPSAQFPMGGPSRDMTERDLSGYLGSVSATGGLRVSFFHTKVKLGGRDPEIAGTYETRLCVAKQPLGDRLTVAHRYLSEEQAQRHFPHEYAAFVQYGEIPTTGTPLHELPGISMSQMGLLALNGLRSIEDLCGIGQDKAAQLGLDVTKAYKVATTWQTRKDEANPTIKAADMEARFEMERKNMQDQMEKISAMNKEMSSQLSAIKSLRSEGIDIGGTQPAQASEPVHQDPEGADELPYDISEMDNPMDTGPEYADGNSDLGEMDDPLG